MLTKEQLIESEGSTFPGKTYAKALLKPVFEDQRKYLFHAMFQVHRAHVVMLYQRGILPFPVARDILHAIEEVANRDPKYFQYDPQCEDLFFQVEKEIAKLIGDLAGNMHIGRSRNDLGVTMYRMVVREKLMKLISAVLELREALLEVSKEHVETVMPAYTHTQPAQPTTFAHYLLAVHDLIARDTKRLWNAFYTVNQCPLGAAAITTTGFAIDREQVKDLLGFTGIVENSYDAVASADYLLETATAVIVLMSNLGRWIQDLLLLCTREFRAIRVADPYVQISSIMPQKRNPVSIEHSRSLSSSAIADAQAVVTMVHNTPFGDIVDTEDDLQPHLYSAIEKALRVIELMTVVIRTMEVNREHLYQRAREGNITITEFSDMLVRDRGVPLRAAHRIARLVATEAERRGLEFYQMKAEWIENVAREVLKKEFSYSPEEHAKLSDPMHFVSVRKCKGGPSAAEVRRMLRVREKEIRQALEDYQQMKEYLQRKNSELRQAIDDILQ
jgi:argininosuccinate lyase